MSSGFSLKDHLFNPEKVRYLSKQIKNVYPSFKDKTFYNAVTKVLPDLELKARITHITTELHNTLPRNYRTATNILLKALPPELDPTKNDDDFGDFIFAPFGEFIAMYGINQPTKLNFSLMALKEITKRFSVEFPIRHYLNTYPEATLTALTQWSKDHNYHVRRLASEGTRPLLPWAIKVSLDNDFIITHILEHLYQDPTRYVIRSVANHLNDIAKSDPGLVLKTLKRWQQQVKTLKKQQPKKNHLELNYLTHHALRTLIKKGHPNTMTFLGYVKPKLKFSQFKTNPKSFEISALKGKGKPTSIHATIESEKNQTLIIDYIITFPSKNSTLPTRKKVFKLTTLKILAGEVYHLHKKHPLRSDMTTFKLYPGEHQVVIQINGVLFGKQGFEITD